MRMKKICFILPEIFAVFTFFRATQTFYRTRVPWSKFANNSRIGWPFFEKTDYMCFPLHLENVEKEERFWGKKINLYCPRTPDWGSVGIFRLSLAAYEIRWSKRSKRGERGKWSIAWKNRMDGICYRKPTITIVLYYIALHHYFYIGTSH